MFVTPLFVGLLACSGADTSPSAPEEAPVAAPSAGEGPALEVLYTNNVHGEIEPCG